MKSTSLFITFEGPDGGGKTTQIRELATYLDVQGIPYILGREPGGTPIGDQVREILHSLKNAGMNPRTEFLLYSASRAQLTTEVIQPALSAGKLVILDRYVDSTFAYQGYGRRLDLDTLRVITRFATDSLIPDCTFYLDIDPEMALTRRQKAAAQGDEWTRLDAEALDFHRRVRKGYEQLIAADPDRWVRIDAAQDVATIQAIIRTELEKRLGLSSRR